MLIIEMQHAQPQARLTGTLGVGTVDLEHDRSICGGAKHTRTICAIFCFISYLNLVKLSHMSHWKGVYHRLRT
jgi:hypothetical protein